MLTQRMMEEKSKMIEMMNEANNIYDGAQRKQAMAVGDSSFSNGFIEKRAAMSGSSQVDVSDLIKPEFLNSGDMN